MIWYGNIVPDFLSIPFILQVAAWLAAFTYPSHRVIYAPGDAFISSVTRVLNKLFVYLRLAQQIEMQARKS
ncbi:hypothetical protein EAE89_08785 [Photorhabdus heterorhabditis]|nr:hypothetical protein [Photorhabdus heterorhabditis]